MRLSCKRRKGPFAADNVDPETGGRERDLSRFGREAVAISLHAYLRADQGFRVEFGSERSLDSPALTGQVAQLVEQRTENPRVGSSILPLATL